MENKFRYFYFTYQAATGLTGAACIPQKTNPDHTQDHGFNFTAATQFLKKQLQTVAVITYWSEVTEMRYIQWNQFMSTTDDGKQAFQSIEGGNEKGTEKKSPSLHVVQPNQD